MKKLPLHQKITVELRAEILGGKYDHQRRLPSEAELVKRFAVSRPTIARALHELKVQGLLERRAGSGTYLRRERPSVREYRHFAFLIPGLHELEIFDVICGEIAALARVHEIGLHWGEGPQARRAASMSIEEAEQLCAHFIATGISGVFFAPFEYTTDNEAANRRITERLKHAGIPVVLLDRDIGSFPQRSGFDLVGIDNFAGGYLLAEHLIKLGARRLAFVTRPFSATTVEARKAGAAAAMLAHGLTLPPDFLHEGDPGEAKFARRLTAGRPYDAVICTNDHTAARLLQTLTRLGVRVPQQLRVVGFDDVRYATLLSVPLTTMHQPCREIALVAFRALQERMTDPTLPARSLLLTPHLVVRESCGAYARE